MAFSADVQVDQSQIASSIGITTITRAISGEVPSQNLVSQSGKMKVTITTGENSVRNLSLLTATIPVMSIVLDNFQRSVDELKGLKESGHVSHADLRRVSAILSELEGFIGDSPRPKSPQAPVIVVLKARPEWVSASPPRRLRTLEDQ